MKKNWKEYWKNSWNLFSLLYFFISIVIYVILIISFIYGAKKNVFDSLSIAGVILLSINLIILLFRWGFAKGIIKGVSTQHKEKIIRKCAKAKYKLNSTQTEKEQIIFEERKAYEKEQKDKEINLLSKPKMTNLVFYLLILISIVSILIFIPHLISLQRG